MNLILFRTQKDLDGKYVLFFRQAIPQWIIKLAISRGYGLSYLPRLTHNQVKCQRDLDRTLLAGMRVARLDVSSRFNLDLTGLKKLENLDSLNIQVPINSKLDLSELRQLVTLSIFGSGSRFVVGLSSLPRLRNVRVQKPSDEFLKSLPGGVRHLEVYGLGKTANLFSLPSGLIFLSMQHLNRFDFTELPLMKSLKSLQFFRIRNIKNEKSISTFAPNLEEIELDRVLLTEQVKVAKALPKSVKLIQDMSEQGRKDYLELLEASSS